MKADTLILGVIIQTVCVTICKTRRDFPKDKINLLRTTSHWLKRSTATENELEAQLISLKRHSNKRDLTFLPSQLQWTHPNNIVENILNTTAWSVPFSFCCIKVAFKGFFFPVWICNNTVLSSQSPKRLNLSRNHDNLTGNWQFFNTKRLQKEEREFFLFKQKIFPQVSYTKYQLHTPQWACLHK